MAIGLEILEGHPNLFCDSKFWGSPDMPEDMEYPMVDDCPLTFLCQIACYDLAPFDHDGLLPDDGMLYFFADLGGVFGDDPTSPREGEWPKGYALVKYTRSVNMETFKSFVMLGDDGEPAVQKAQPLRFSSCLEGYEGMRMLGEAPEGRVTLLRLPLDPQRTLCFTIKDTDLGFGNWKKANLTLINTTNS